MPAARRDKLKGFDERTLVGSAIIQRQVLIFKGINERKPMRIIFQRSEGSGIA